MWRHNIWTAVHGTRAEQKTRIVVYEQQPVHRRNHTADGSDGEATTTFLSTIFITIYFYVYFFLANDTKTRFEYSTDPRWVHREYRATGNHKDVARTS